MFWLFRWKKNVCLTFKAGNIFQEQLRLINEWSIPTRFNQIYQNVYKRAIVLKLNVNNHNYCLMRKQLHNLLWQIENSIYKSVRCPGCLQKRSVALKLPKNILDNLAHTHKITKEWHCQKMFYFWYTAYFSKMLAFWRK